MIKISHEIPDIYYECQKRYGVKWAHGVVITYGDTVYVNSGFQLDGSLQEHEGTHIRQQLKIGADVWWKRYFDEPEFRLSQEKEAYINQSKWLKRNIKNRELRFRVLNKIIADFSGPMYGSIITRDEAKKLLM